MSSKFSKWVKEKNKTLNENNKEFVNSVWNKYAPKMPQIDHERYSPIKDMEGPFMLKSGKVVYYDPKQGKYYDRDSDMFMDDKDYHAHSNSRNESNFAAINSEEMENQELEMLGKQMQNVMGKLTNLISRMKNKNKGYALLHQVAQAIQSSTGATDNNIKNAALGNLPSQRNQ